MKWKILILLLVFIVAAAAHAATNDLTGLLQKGLFEEEANRDLDAAISNYQMLAGQFDKDRQTAATAIFRLGECYRKLGKTNEAVAQYQRILREFPDQQTLATLSQQNLTGLGVSTGTQANQAKNGSINMEALQQQIVDAQAQLAQSEAVLTNLKSMNSDDLRKALPGLIPDDQLNTLMDELNLAEQQLINLQNDYSPDNPKYKTGEAQVKELNQKVNDRIEGILLGLQAKINAETAYLNALKTKSQGLPPYGSLSLAGGEEAVERMNRQLAATQAQLNRDEQRLSELLSRYTSTNPNVVELQGKVESERASLTAQLQRIEASRAQDTTTPVTDEEQKQIRRIQLMIQDSPDLINAGTQQSGTPLQSAAWAGQLVVARYLLDHGADVDKRVMGDTGFYGTATPLCIAAINGHKAMVELLLARAADVNGAGGMNPLFEAVSKDYQEVANVLIANKADVNFANNSDSGKTPLMLAATKNQTNMAQLLISHGARLDAKNKDGHTALFFAACDNSVDVAKILIASGANVDARDNNNETPLHGAAFYGQPEMISFFMDHGASVDATNIRNATPLLLAVAKAHTDAVRVLLQYKADPNHSGTISDWVWPDTGRVENWTGQPIFIAIILKNDEMLRLLVDAGADPNTDTGAATILAIEHNYTEGVQLLLDHGANPNRVPRGMGVSPLIEALQQGRDPQIIKSLLDKGADPNVRDQNGLTPLMISYSPDVIRWLIEHKADVNAKTKDGRTALMLRRNNVWPEDPEKYRILLENGANPDLQDAQGNTALHHFVSSVQTNIIALLLEHKANPNIQNDDGLTPLDLAEQQLKIEPPIYGFQGTVISTEGHPTRGQILEKIVTMLTKAGGLANLPKRDRIEVRRGANLSNELFTKGSHDWNHFSLLELVARQYGLLSTQSSGSWSSTAQGVRWALWSGNKLPFPDFKNVIIYRRLDNNSKQKAIQVNVEDILDSGDCARDVPLEWGDVVEIPEADHPVDQKWQGPSEQVFTSLTNCIARQVTLKIKGETTTLKLSPEIMFGNLNPPDERFILVHASFMLRSVLDNSRLLRVSSDLAHVKVTRHDPITGKTEEWTVDCTNARESDFWLRDGDVIEVPEK